MTLLLLADVAPQVWTVECGKAAAFDASTSVGRYGGVKAKPFGSALARRALTPR